MDKDLSGTTWFDLTNQLRCNSDLACRHGAPEKIRTPNLLIRSAKFTHSGKDYLGFCVLWLPHRGLKRHPKAGINGQSNGQDPLALVVGVLMIGSRNATRSTR
jgi:hypothetical protein